MAFKVDGPGHWGFHYSNVTAPVTTEPGTSVTPGVSNAEGAATQIASAANISEDVYAIDLRVSGANANATSKNHLLDIGYDPAGGTAWTWIVSNLQCGDSPVGAGTLGCWSARIPLFIPAGSAVAVRVQGNAATAGVARILMEFFGLPVRPDMVPHLSKSETLGTITNSRGESVTLGVSAAEGAWTLIGTTTFRWRYLIPTFAVDDATKTNQQVNIDIGYGSATTPVIVVRNNRWAVGSGEAVSPWEKLGEWCDIPSGASIYARGSTSIATADAINAVLVTGLG